MNTVLMRRDNQRCARSLILAAVVILLALVLSACGAKVQTSLTIDGNGAGSRVMALSAELDSDTTENINGGAAEIDASIQKHLPEGLEYSGMTVDGANISGTFTLSFDSIEDYQDKASALLTASGVNEEAEVKFVNSKESLVSGVALEENFTSEDLMGWIAEGLVVDGIVSADDQSAVFDTSEVSKVTIDGTDYSADYEPIYIDEVTENGFDYIGVFLDVTSGSGYDVTVQYGLSDVPSAPVKEAQDAYLADATVTGGKLADMSSADMEDIYADAGYTMTFHSDDEAALEADLGQALGTDDVAFTFTTSEPASDSLVYTVAFEGSADLYHVTNPGASADIALTVPPSWVAGAGGFGIPDDDGNTVFYGDVESNAVVIDASFERGITVSDVTATLDVGMNHDVTQNYAFTVNAQDAAQFDEAIKQALVGSNSELSVTTEEGEETEDAASGQSGTTSGAESGSSASTIYKLTVPDDQDLDAINASIMELPDGTYAVMWTGDLSECIPGASIQKATATVNLGLLNSFVSEDRQSSSTSWDMHNSSATKTMSPDDGFYLDFSQQAKGWKLGALIGLCVGLGILLVVIILIVVFRKKIAALFKRSGTAQPAPQVYQPGPGQPGLPATGPQPGPIQPGAAHNQSTSQPGPAQPGQDQATSTPGSAQASPTGPGQQTGTSQQMPLQPGEPPKQDQPPKRENESGDFDEFNLM